MKEVLFSVTADDCEWSFFKGSGNGGQNKHKNSTGAQCIHHPSKAIGRASDTRSQLQNKRLAFKRMAESHQFELWVKKMVGEHIPSREEMESWLDEQLKEENLKIEMVNPSAGAGSTEPR